MSYKSRPIALMADDDLVRVKDILEFFRISTATLHRWRTARDFPMPINGANASIPYWRAKDIREFQPYMSKQSNDIAA